MPQQHCRQGSEMFFVILLPSHPQGRELLGTTHLCWALVIRFVMGEKRYHRTKGPRKQGREERWDRRMWQSETKGEEQ